nr:cytochrome b6 [Solanum imamense]UNZ92752.1 cytochrome b6 [Solanum imamense]
MSCISCVSHRRI